MYFVSQISKNRLGIRIEGDQIEEVAFKEANNKDYDRHWGMERDIYERIGEHGKFGRF